MKPEEFAARRSLEIIDATIKQLCLQRDQLVASLPDAPRPARLKVACNGREIRLGGGKKKKQTEVQS
jgi:hypothetical protein